MIRNFQVCFFKTVGFFLFGLTLCLISAPFCTQIGRELTPAQGNQVSNLYSTGKLVTKRSLNVFSKIASVFESKTEQEPTSNNLSLEDNLTNVLSSFGPPYASTPPILCQRAQFEYLNSTQCETMAMLASIFRFALSPRRARFDWWWRLIVQQVLLAVIPINLDLSITSSASVSADAVPAPRASVAEAIFPLTERFRVCPPPVVAFIADQFYQMHQTQALSEILLSGFDVVTQQPSGSAKFVLHIFNQVLALPTLFSPSIHRVGSIFIDWAKGDRAAKTADPLVVSALLRTFLTQSLSVWFVDAKKLRDGPADEFNAKLFICAHTVEFYRALSTPSDTKRPLSMANWERLLVIMLNGCNYLIMNDDNSDPSLHESLIFPAIRGLFDVLGALTLSCSDLSIDVEFINTAESNSADSSESEPTAAFVQRMWCVLSEKVQTCWMYWFPFVQEWRARLVELSQSLLTQIAEIQPQAGDFLLARAKAQQGDQSGKKALPTKFFQLFCVWERFLYLLGQPTLSPLPDVCGSVASDSAAAAAAAESAFAEYESTLNAARPASLASMAPFSQASNTSFHLSSALPQFSESPDQSKSAAQLPPADLMWRRSTSISEEAYDAVFSVLQMFIDALTTRKVLSASAKAMLGNAGAAAASRHVLPSTQTLLMFFGSFLFQGATVVPSASSSSIQRKRVVKTEAQTSSNPAASAGGHGSGYAATTLTEESIAAQEAAHAAANKAPPVQVTAVACLCRLMSIRSAETPSSDWLVRFVDLVHTILHRHRTDALAALNELPEFQQTAITEAAFAVIQHSAALFEIGIPEFDSLILDLINASHAILSPASVVNHVSTFKRGARFQFSITAPLIVRRSAMVLLNSLVAHSHRFGELPLVDLESLSDEGSSAPSTPQSSISFGLSSFLPFSRLLYGNADSTPLPPLETYAQIPASLVCVWLRALRDDPSPLIRCTSLWSLGSFVTNALGMSAFSHAVSSVNSSASAAAMMKPVSAPSIASDGAANFVSTLSLEQLSRNISKSQLSPAGIVDVLISILAHCVKIGDDTVALAAIECIRGFSLQPELFFVTDSSSTNSDELLRAPLVALILEGLCLSALLLVQILQENETKKAPNTLKWAERIMPPLLYCLQDWVTCLPASFWQSSRLSSWVFSSLQAALDLSLPIHSVNLLARSDNFSCSMSLVEPGVHDFLITSMCACAGVHGSLSFGRQPATLATAAALLSGQTSAPQSAPAAKRASRQQLLGINQAVDASDVPTMAPPSLPPPPPPPVTPKAARHRKHSSAMSLSEVLRMDPAELRAMEENECDEPDYSDLPPAERAGAIKAKQAATALQALNLRSAPIREAADCVLSHIAHRVLRFPAELGAAQYDSAAHEEADENSEQSSGWKRLYLVVDSQTLLTLMQRNSTDGAPPMARLIVRDMSGKYSWDLMPHSFPLPAGAVSMKRAMATNAAIKSDANSTAPISTSTCQLVSMPIGPSRPSADSRVRSDPNSGKLIVPEKRDVGVGRIHAVLDYLYEIEQQNVPLPSSNMSCSFGEVAPFITSSTSAAVESCLSSHRAAAVAFFSPHSSVAHVTAETDDLISSATAVELMSESATTPISALPAVAWPPVSFAESCEHVRRHARFEYELVAANANKTDVVPSEAPCLVTPLDQCRLWMAHFQFLRAPGFGSSSSRALSSSVLLNHKLPRPLGVQFDRAGAETLMSSLVSSSTLRGLPDSHIFSAYARLASKLYHNSITSEGIAINDVTAKFPKSDITDCSLQALALSQEYAVFLKTEHRTTMKILDEGGAKLQRSLKLLDTTPSRECHKIGVVYVAPGQDEQKIILRNEQGSADYEAFVDALGWPVDVSQHPGFLGGLDPHGATGKYTPYFATSSVEMIFHVVTRMPTVASDSQQVHKKRQVGNDHVHIVWSDHSRDYLTATISSHFNDVHIVIYPLPGDNGACSGFYRIQIHRKEDKVPLFGPLMDGAVVPAALLPSLVRQTALNANRAVRYNQAGFNRPFPTRKKYIDEIITRHAQVESTDKFISNFFQ
jgi:hypothetical protein